MRVIWRVRSEIRMFLTAKPISIGLAVLCFYPKTGFWPSYCQISTDLNKILHTPIIVRIALRPRSAHGWLHAKPKRLCFFCNTCNAPQVLYRDVESPRFRRQTVRVEVRTPCWKVLSWKIPEFCSMGGARSKTAFILVFRVSFDYPAHSLQETVSPQTTSTDGKPRLWRYFKLTRH